MRKLRHDHPPTAKSELAAATNTAPKKCLRNLLSRRLEQIEDRLYANAAVNGYGDITPAMAQFYSHMAGLPIHMAELTKGRSICPQLIRVISPIDSEQVYSSHKYKSSHGH